MPMYEYTCGDCGAEFEELVRLPDDERGLRCPSCGAAKARRRLSTFAAHAADPPRAALPAGGCGRCGDPNGSCGLGG